MSTNQPEDDGAPDAHRLMAAALVRELADGDDLTRAMSAVCDRLGHCLTRWVGGDGWQALLQRSLTEADRAHGDHGLSVDDLGRMHGRVDVVTREGCERVLIAIVEVLGRFVGPGMALRLIEIGLAEGDGESPGGSDHG